jgi:hypothetical protein
MSDRRRHSDPIAALAAANAADRLAADLDRRGGGLAAHAADLARDRAERERRTVEQLGRSILDGTADMADPLAGDR